jgi:hypothetical protein
MASGFPGPGDRAADPVRRQQRLHADRVEVNRVARLVGVDLGERASGGGEGGGHVGVVAQVERLRHGQAVQAQVPGAVVLDGLGHADRPEREQGQDRQQADAHDEDGHQHFNQRGGGSAVHGEALVC